MPDNKKPIKKGLGRSFDSLIPTDLFDESFDPTLQQDDAVSDLRTIKISEIYADPDQPRRQFDEPAIDELAASIREHGILQPLVVMPRRAGGYMIVAGERRFRAAGRAGLDRLPVLVRTLSDQHKLELSIIENVQRRDLTAIEVAVAYGKLRDQFNLTLEQIGERVGGKSASAISNTLRLLRLPHEVKSALADGTLTEGQARPLIGKPDAEATALLRQITKDHLSARQVEQLAANSADKPRASRASGFAAREAHPASAQLSTALGMPVRIAEKRGGNGTLSIDFANPQQLEDLIRRLQ